MPKRLYGLAITQKVASFIESMPPGKLRAQILKKVKSLVLDFYPAGCKKLKVAKGEESVWRIRSGDYRILYVVRENEVIVLDIDHRKDVYK